MTLGAQRSGQQRPRPAPQRRLASLVPPELDILTGECGLPALPNFAINLHLRRHQVGLVVLELARRVRHAWSAVAASHRLGGYDGQVQSPAQAPNGSLSPCLFRPG